MAFYSYRDVINGEGTIYTLKAKNKTDALEKLKTICPFGWRTDRIIKIEWQEIINKDFLRLLIKGILRKDFYQKW